MIADVRQVGRTPLAAAVEAGFPHGGLRAALLCRTRRRLRLCFRQPAACSVGHAWADDQAILIAVNAAAIVAGARTQLFVQLQAMQRVWSSCTSVDHVQLSVTPRLASCQQCCALWRPARTDKNPCWILPCAAPDDIGAILLDKLSG